MSETWPLGAVPADELRVIRFKPAFHRCDPDPAKDYGIGTVTMLWVLRVGDLAVVWEVFTGWDLPTDAFKAAVPGCIHPLHQNGAPGPREASGGAVQWPTPGPQYEGHEGSREPCSITGSTCYVSSGFLLASELLDLLRIEGDDAVWKRLRDLLDEVRVLPEPGSPEAKLAGAAAELEASVNERKAAG